ncbi:MAG: zinc-dependent alcohol dehydrogenase [Phototrophicaceae bacterium]
MIAHLLQFVAERQVTVIEQSLPPLQAHQVRVKTTLSAISAGTELLVYRNQFPRNMAVDASIDALAGAFAYPLAYGYALVGRVVEVGTEVERSWEGRRVFAFQPHASSFITTTDALLPIPHEITDADAICLPNMETAVNLVQDGAPLLGESVAVFGQGVVGLLTTALLSRFPLGHLVTVEGLPIRRATSYQAGAHNSLSLDAIPPTRFDLIFECSGSPSALNTALGWLRHSGRVVVGSWYGDKMVTLNLGEAFHRERLRIISSQVSTLAPELSGRWDKARRMNVAWEALRWVQPSRWITHRYPLADAPTAYHLLDTAPHEALQVVFEYPD